MLICYVSGRVAFDLSSTQIKPLSAHVIGRLVTDVLLGNSIGAEFSILFRLLAEFLRVLK